MTRTVPAGQVEESVHTGHWCSMFSTDAGLLLSAAAFLRRQLGHRKRTLVIAAPDLTARLSLDLKNEGFPVDLLAPLAHQASGPDAVSMADQYFRSILTWIESEQSPWAVMLDVTFAFTSPPSAIAMVNLARSYEGCSSTHRGACLVLFDRRRVPARTLLALLPMYSVLVDNEFHCNPFYNPGPYPSIDDQEEAVLSSCLHGLVNARALERSETGLKTVIDRSPEPIIIEQRGRIVLVNPACLALLKYQSSDELLGHELSSLVHPEDREASKTRLETPLTPIGETIVEERYLRRDKSTVLLEVAIVPVLFERKAAIALIARDATERSRMARRLAQADRMASVGTLAAGVAHEINNPLTYVMWNLQTLRDALPKIADSVEKLQGFVATLPSNETPLLAESVSSWDAKKIRALADRASEAADGSRRIRDIVRALKTFSRDDDEKLAHVDVNSAVEAAINLAYNEIKYRAKLLRDLGDLPLVLADDGRLAQVFVNLLINAAHAIQEGNSQENEIRVSTYLSAGEVVIEVSDTGHGIAPDHIGKIFDPFFTTKPQGMGSGLGLFICHNIVRTYSGRIEVQSTLGSGSRFSVFLPSATEHRDPSRPAPPLKSEPPAGGSTRILIIDDEAMVGTVLQRMLEHEHTVVVAQSAAEAKAILEAEPSFDLVLSDLLMPGMSGMELYEWVRNNLPGLEPWMLFMTGGAFTVNARDFLGRLARPYLEKPFDPKEVRSLVRTMIKKRRALKAAV